MNKPCVAFAKINGTSVCVGPFPNVNRLLDWCERTGAVCTILYVTKPTRFRERTST